jgi:hypothetical protein
VKHLTSRMKSKDFHSLKPEIKKLYENKLAEHQQFIKDIAKEQMEAQAGFIPSGGALVKTDFYVNPDPNNPDKAQRAIFPTEALEWLRKRLEGQGSTQDMMNSFQNQAAVGDVSKMLASDMSGQGQQPSDAFPLQPGGFNGFPQ